MAWTHTTDMTAERVSQEKETHRLEQLSRLSLQHVQYLQSTLCIRFDGYDTAVPKVLSVSTASNADAAQFVE